MKGLINKKNKISLRSVLLNKQWLTLYDFYILVYKIYRILDPDIIKVKKEKIIMYFR